MINLPTWITIIRIFLTPVLVVVLMTRVTYLEPFGLSWQMIGVIVFLVASFTDFLDGWLARRRNEVTTLGILLDPIADKLLTSAALISLVQIGVARAWMVWVIIGREFAVDGLRMIASSQGVTIAASIWEVQDRVTGGGGRPAHLRQHLSGPVGFGRRHRHLGRGDRRDAVGRRLFREVLPAAGRRRRPGRATGRRPWLGSAGAIAASFRGCASCS